MSAEAVIFYVFGAITVLSAAVVVLARSLIYSAFALLFTFFGVMLTHKLYDLDLRSEVTQFGAGIIVAAGLFVILIAVAVRTQWRVGPGRPPSVTTAEVGRLFMGQYLLPFEAASILLLVALMGAAMIVRRKNAA